MPLSCNHSCMRCTCMFGVVDIATDGISAFIRAVHSSALLGKGYTHITETAGQ